jgi:hypothetical protein
MNHKVIAILAAILLFPALAMGGQVEGSIQGLSCVIYGKTCPVGQEDVIAALETNFVLYTYDGTAYVISNIRHHILARYLNKEVRVTGEVNKEKKMIYAEKMEVKEAETWRTTWSEAMEKEALKYLGIGP